MSYNKIIVVTCTKKSSNDFYTSTSLGKSLTKNPFYDDIIIFSNNTEGLSKRYNEAISGCKNKNNYIFLFVHDDVTLNDIYIGDYLQKYSNTYDIMGVAGTRRFNVRSPVIWNQDREFFVGYVTQKDNDQYWCCPYGKSPDKAMIIDGLFMGVKGNVFDKIKFDENFTFHHYDIDFCLSAHTNNISRGVIPVNICHDSVGDWKNSEVWHKSEKIFLNKWK